MALGLFTSKSPTKDHPLANLCRSRARARDRASSKGVGGDSCVRCRAEVVDGKTSVTGASRVTRQLLFHHSENRRSQSHPVQQCPLLWWQLRSTASLRCTRTAVCSVCLVTSGKGTSAAGQFSRVGTPCICSEPPVIMSTADFSPGDIIFDCNVQTIATLLPEHTKQLPTWNKDATIHLPHLEWKSHNLQCMDRIVDVTVVLQRQVRPIHALQKVVKFSAVPRSQLRGRHGCGQEFKTKSVRETLEVSRTEKFSGSRASSVIPLGSERRDSCGQGSRRLQLQA